MSIPWFVNIFLTVIVVMATVLAPVRWPNIDDVTCLLAPSVALQGSQYQAMDRQLQGSRRSYKTPIATTITNFIIIASITPLVDDAKNGRPSQRSSLTSNRVHPKSHLHIFYPHNARQWSGELDHYQFHHHCLHHPPRQ